MNTSTAPQKPKRPRLWLKRLAWSFAWLVTLLALVIVIENWTGARAWKQCLTETEASGLSLTLSSYTPRGIPDEENFAEAPFIKKLTAMTPEDTRVYLRLLQPEGSSSSQLKIEGWREGRFVNLESWRDRYRNSTGDPRWKAHFENLPDDSGVRQSPAEEVLYGMKMFDQELEGLKEAAKRHQSLFPFDYEFNPETRKKIPFAVLRFLSSLTTLRSVAELSLKRPDEAFQDTMLSFSVVESLEKHPIMVSVAIRAGMMDSSIQTIWEGLMKRQWSEAQLAQFETSLRDLNFAQEYQRAIQQDLAWSVEAADFAKQHRKAYLGMEEDLSKYGKFPKLQLLRALQKCLPGGWYDHSKVFIVQNYKRPLACVDTNTWQFKQGEDWEYMDFWPWGYLDHRLLANIAVPSFSGFMRRCAATQGGVGLARIAIALERHRLAHGDYPETLAALDDTVVPDGGLPTDVTDGTQAHYKRISAERFLLYFNGWDGKDNGGALDPKNDWLRSTNPRVDWVWPMPSEEKSDHAL